MAQEWWAYDGSTWREAVNAYVYDGASWRKIKEGWVYDGATWRQFFAACDVSLDSATADPDGVSGCCGCAAGKCDVSVDWTYTNAVFTEHHIRILTSINGGSYFEEVDDHNIGSLGSGTYTDECVVDGNDYDYKVRLENNGTDNLTCGDSNNERLTGASPCGVF